MHHLHTYDAWLHVANVLYLLAYLVRDILWLRILTVVAALCLLPYYFCCSEHPLYAPIAWNALFTVVNIVQIALLILERRPVFLGEDELRLYRTIFKTLKPREFLRLMGVAQWKRASPGQRLMEQGDPVTELMLLAHGSADIEVNRNRIASVAAGQFVGEMGFLTNQRASASVIAAAAIDYLAWPAEELRVLLADSPQLHIKVHGILGVDLVGKIRREATDPTPPEVV